MSEDLICADCGRPFSEHDEFREAVNERVEQKLAEHEYFTQLVAHKMSPDTVPKPRTESLDALEHARAHREVDAKVADLKKRIEVGHRSDGTVAAREHTGRRAWPCRPLDRSFRGTIVVAPAKAGERPPVRVVRRAGSSVGRAPH